MKYVLLPLIWIGRGLDWLSRQMDEAERYWRRRKREKEWNEDPPF